MIGPPPRSTLFPYTTLFRSVVEPRRFELGGLRAREHPECGAALEPEGPHLAMLTRDRKSTRLNSSHSQISYAVFCLKKKQNTALADHRRRESWLRVYYPLIQ